MASRYHFAAPRPSLSETLGSALGTGLGAGLTQLAESKLNSMLSRQKQGQLTAEFVKLGIPEQQAEFLAKQDPETQWQTVRQWWMSQGFDGSDIPSSINEQWQAQSPLDALGTLEQPTAAGPQNGAIAAVQSLGQQQAAQQSNAMAALAPQAPTAPIAPQAQPAPIPQMPKQRKARDLGEAFRMAEETTPKAAATGKKPSLSPDAKIFIENTEKKAELAGPLLKELNAIEDYIDKHGKEISTDIFSANAPDSFLNTPTKELRRKMSAFLNKLIQIESSGRGSDLLRRIISEGKLNLQQGPEAWKEALTELRGEQQDNLRLAELKDEIRKTFGYTPEDIAGLARETLSTETGEFKSLPDSEKVQYLFNHPNQMKWITEITDENGKVIARRSGKGWQKVGK